VTSLVLAVLAIIYAFVSNASLGQTLSAVGDASREITAATTTLRGELTAIPTSLRSMEAKLDTISMHREEDFTEKPPSKVAGKVHAPEPNAKVQTIDDVATAFVGRTSIWGLLIIHACAIAYTKKIAFDLLELVTKTERLQHQYARGFLVATGSAGLVVFTLVHGVVNVTGIHDALRTKARENYMQKVVSIDDPKAREILNNALAHVESFFEK